MREANDFVCASCLLHVIPILPARDPFVNATGRSRSSFGFPLSDPQTSGGLLVAVPQSRLSQYLSNVDNATEIGQVLEREESAIVVD
jgi:hypothetical protein